MKQTALKRGRKPKRSDAEKALAERWHTEAARRSCVCCGAPGPCDGHHLLEKPWIRDACKRLGLDPAIVVWDQRGFMACCRQCHRRHHDAVKRISWRLLPADVFELARELGLEERLRRTYGGPDA